MLIDGVRVNQSGGAFDFSRIAAGEIERVEVVRGAQSSLWGSDAMGSVVQVFTRRAGAADGRVAGRREGGIVRHGARRRARARRRLRVDYHAGITSRRTSGAFDDVLPEEDRFDQTAIRRRVWRCARLPRHPAHRAALQSTAHGRAVGPFDLRRRRHAAPADTQRPVVAPRPSHTASARATTGRASCSISAPRAMSADTVADPFFNVYTPAARARPAPASRTARGWYGC